MGAADRSASSHAPLGRQSSAVISGEPSDTSQDAVVLLVHYDPDTRSAGQCTGTLLAPRLVLTARHCVADTDPNAACTAEGDSLAGGEIRRNRKASTLYVFTGQDRPDFHGEIEADGEGMKILDNGGENLCNNDIALLVLKEPVKNAKIAPIRLDTDVEKGELITAVGWGVTEKTPQPAVRMQRTGVQITGVGPDEDAMPPVPSKEFEVGESICSGDSGGPAFAEATGAVIGVVSRGGNNTRPDETDPSATCIEGNNLYTKVSAFKDLILQAYELAEQEPWLEGQPDPRKAKVGEACTEASDCRSDLCAAEPSSADGATTCAAPCTEDSECTGEGEKCLAAGDVFACRVPKPLPPRRASGGFCTYAPAEPSASGAGAALIAAAAVLLSASRRRRRR